MKEKNSGRDIVVIAIGIVLFFILGRFSAIGIAGSNETVNLNIGILAMISAFFGPVAGVIAGFLGQTAVEMSWFGFAVGRFAWDNIIAMAGFGFLMGFFAKGLYLHIKRKGGKKILLFQIMQVITNFAVWVIIAPVCNTLFFRQGMKKELATGLVAWLANVIIVAVISGIWLWLYFKPKKEKTKKASA